MTRLTLVGIRFIVRGQRNWCVEGGKNRIWVATYIPQELRPRVCLAWACSVKWTLIVERLEAEASITIAIVIHDDAII